MESREEILRRLHNARGALQLPSTPPLPPLETITASVDECVARFSVEAAALGVDCFVETSAADVRTRLNAVLRDARVLSWDLEHLPYDVGSVLSQPLFGRSRRDEQATAGIGLTGCDCAIAESASLVLFSGPGKSRAVSLLPPIHVAIVQRTKLCHSMAEMFTRHRGQLCDAASCTVVTGPSRTADIELTLTLGIHGPGRVVVIIGP